MVIKARDSDEGWAAGDRGTPSTGRAVDGPSLDPHDWDAFAEMAHQVLDAMIHLQRDVSEGPVWRPMTDEVRARFEEPAPHAPGDPRDLCSRVQEWVVPYRTGNIHPRFWGWVAGTGTPLGMLAELMAGGMNQISGIFDDSARAVHSQVVSWMKELMGFPSLATGVVVSGGSVANLAGLAAAREARAHSGEPGTVAQRGVRSLEAPPVLYASTETHQSVDKAVQLMGLGREALRKIPVDDHFRISMEELARQVARDRMAGHRPFAVVGNAGSVNTGAVDDLAALADFCEAQDLWLHVDGAFGAMARLSEELRPLVRGMERADSLGFDFHKWLHVQYEAGCVLVRDAHALEAAFSASGDYLVSLPRGVGAAGAASSKIGPQLSRGFKSLKVWMCLQEHGIDRYAQVIARNVRQARYLASRVDETPELERLAPVELNVVCFRYAGDGSGASDESLDDLNQEIVMQLHERGAAVPSYTILDGRFVIRVAISNHRTRAHDLDLLVEQVVELGGKLAQKRPYDSESH